MHGEEQQLQIQQEPLDPQLLSRVKQIIARRNTEFILDHQNDSLEQLSAYLKACMEDIGHPILGDRKYSSSVSFGRLALHASVLEFRHPMSGKIMRFDSPTPKEFLKLIK